MHEFQFALNLNRFCNGYTYLANHMPFSFSFLHDYSNDYSPKAFTGRIFNKYIKKYFLYIFKVARISIRFFSEIFSLKLTLNLYRTQYG